MNLISPRVISKLRIAEEELKVTGTFQGINPGRSRPKGKITLPVMLGGELNYRTKKVVFDVVDLPLPYNGILGCPSLAKFMASSRDAYNTLKMLRPIGVISIPSDKKDAIICMDKMYRDAVAVEAAAMTVPAKESKGKKGIVGPPARGPGSVPPSSARHPLTTCRSVPTARDPRLLHPK